jgi:hypothetical protein
LSLKERWFRYLEEHERFWRVCLEVARSNPHLCAEDVEAEAIDMMIGLRPEPRQTIYYDPHRRLSMVLGETVMQVICNYLQSRHNVEMNDLVSKREEFRIILGKIMGDRVTSMLEEKLISI